MIHILLQHDVKLDIEGKHDRTILSYIVERGDEAAVRLLLKIGAHVEGEIEL
jgi:hypothetical protein